MFVKGFLKLSLFTFLALTILVGLFGMLSVRPALAAPVGQAGTADTTVPMTDTMPTDAAAHLEHMMSRLDAMEARMKGMESRMKGMESRMEGMGAQAGGQGGGMMGGGMNMAEMHSMMAEMHSMLAEMHRMRAGGMGNMMEGMMGGMMGGMMAGGKPMTGEMPAGGDQGMGPRAGAPAAGAQSAKLGEIEVKVTPSNLADLSGETVDFTVDLNGAAGTLNLDLAKLAVLRAGGMDVEPESWAVVLDHGHHVSGTLQFPTTHGGGHRYLEGAGELTVVIRQADGEGEAAFTWPLPQ